MVALQTSVLFGFGEFSKKMKQTFAEANMSIEFRKKFVSWLTACLTDWIRTHLAITHYRSLQSVPAGHPSRTLFLQVLFETVTECRTIPHRWNDRHRLNGGCRYQLDITWTMMVFNPGHFFLQIVNKKVPVLFQDCFINHDFSGSLSITPPPEHLSHLMSWDDISFVARHRELVQNCLKA